MEFNFPEMLVPCLQTNDIQSILILKWDNWAENLHCLAEFVMD